MGRIKQPASGELNEQLMYSLKVFLVLNSRIRFSESGRVELIVVERGADVADDWIADHVSENDIVVTGVFLLPQSA